MTDKKTYRSLGVYPETRDTIRTEAMKRGMKISALVDRMAQNYFGQRGI